MIYYEAAPLCYRPNARAGEFVNVAVFMVTRGEFGVIEDMRLLFERKTGRISNFLPGCWHAASFSLWRAEAMKRFTVVKRRTTRESVTSGALSFDQLCADVHSATAGSFFWGRVTVGAADTSDQAWDELYHDLIGRHVDDTDETGLSDRQLWEQAQPVISNNLQRLIALNLVQFEVPVSHDLPEPVHMRWRNGVEQILEPLSFDVKTSETIREKAQRATGRLFQFGRRKEFRCTLLVAPPTLPKLAPIYQEQKRELEQTPWVRKIIPPEGLPDFLKIVESEAKPLAG